MMNLLLAVIVFVAVASAAYILLFLQIKARQIAIVRKGRNDSNDVLDTAQQQADQIIEQANDQNKMVFDQKIDAFYTKIEARQIECEEFEISLTEREEAGQKLEQMLTRKELTLDRLKRSGELINERLLKNHSTLDEITQRVVKCLEDKSLENRDKIKHLLVENIVESENTTANHWLKNFVEETKENVSRVAQDVLSTVMARFSPHFIPTRVKSLFIFESTGPRDQFTANDNAIAKALMEKGDLKIEQIEENGLAFKISEGLGVDKECARLVIEEFVEKKEIDVSLVDDAFDRHKKRIMAQLKSLGDRHFKAIGLDDMHPELLKIITFLNYRTSFTQNQFYHTLEVAELFGLLAAEMGLDVKTGKRMGLLHDLGKALDYKIQKSHAIISADVAEEYGESELVCTTVKSHHNDILVETPWADLLKAADALSSARPGARVDLEEGYTRRIDSIRQILDECKEVASSAIMHAGREVRVYVDSKKVGDSALAAISEGLARRIEEEVKYPGQVKLTVSRRLELSSSI